MDRGALWATVHEVTKSLLQRTDEATQHQTENVSENIRQERISPETWSPLRIIKQKT